MCTQISGVFRAIWISCYVVLNVNFYYFIQWKEYVESQISCNIQRWKNLNDKANREGKFFFFFFLLLPCLNLNLILVLSFGKVLLTPVQGHFHSSVRCSFTEFCPTLETWQLQGWVTFAKGWQTHGSRNFQYPYPWNPWTWWNRPFVEENPLQHTQRALEYPI